MPVPRSEYEFKFVILGRYPARLKENDSQLTVNLATGHRGHVTQAAPSRCPKG
jgi:hypothetical protein